MDAGSSWPLELPQQFRQFTISEINLATQNFDESLIIGRGGFGTVYKGTVTNRASSLVVAVKRLDSSSNQGAEEFWNEVEMLSQLRHCHLVSLIGYCNEGQEMILVYEYMPHGTLGDHLHKLLSILPWVRRLKICIGAAHGLNYLHTGTGITHGIIHRDVKSSNILLDNSWAAKVSDFGLSKLGPINQPSTYVNTFVKGTFGYLDPDYFATGRLTRKSDVYAFGVVLFEVLSGKQAVDKSLDEEHWGLVNWAQESVKQGRLKQMVDYNIRERILPKCLKEFGRLAVRCVHSNPKRRPTMAEVVACLESVLALQEKANNTSHPSAGMRIFGNKVSMFLSSFSGDKSGLTKTDQFTPKLQTILEDKDRHADAEKSTVVFDDDGHGEKHGQTVADDLGSSWDLILGFATTDNEDCASARPIGIIGASIEDSNTNIHEPTEEKQNKDITLRNDATVLPTSSNVLDDDEDEASDSRQSGPLRCKTWHKGAFIGKGSHGTVYEAFNEHGIFFAVKEVSLLDEGYEGKRSIVQLEQEISLLSQFKHENIVRYLGTETGDGKLYIFLELAAKGSLASVYKKYHLGDSQVSVYTRQILSGLNYLHERNVVHRDISCANILVDVSGSVKLANFGVAKATELNGIQSIEGTAHWMAPEVVKRKSNGYGLAADIWSLGCTVLEMLTRKIPYSHLEGIQALFKIGRGIPPPIPETLSEDAQDFIVKCLQANPNDRPTAAQLLMHPFVNSNRSV